MSVVVSLFDSLRLLVRSRAALQLEIIALRHQLAVVNRSRRQRLRLTSADRLLWAWVSRLWCGWHSAIHIVKPETVIAWHRRDFVCSGCGRVDTAPAARRSRTTSAR
jgi:hypothetical protein